MILENIFKQIDFVDRYKDICEKHNNFEKSMSGNDRKSYSEIIARIDKSATYSSKDHTFKSSFSLNEHTIDLVLSLKNGHVQPYLNYLNDGGWILYNRFDGYAEELDSNLDTEIYNIPKYVSFEELETILKELFTIYEDFKIAFINHLESK